MTQQQTKKRLPDWFRTSIRKKEATLKLSQRLKMDVPNSICEEARCPNRSECFKKGVLTFMIMGTTCTRNCKFCSVAHGKPMPLDKGELDTLLYSIDTLSLKFVVLTSPNRDDLKDGGAGHYHYIVKGIKQRFPKVKVEVLIPDFQGDMDALKTVIEARPDVLNHNVETVPSLYTRVRKGSLYKRSLSLLAEVKKIDPSMLSKSGLMVGLGEGHDELVQTFKDIRQSNVDILTLGQYLRPDRHSVEVARYYHPNEFKQYQKIGEDVGFRFVFSGPLVRSSYLAEHVFDDTLTSTPYELNAS